MPITEQPVQSPLSAELQAILRCLSCGSNLESDQAAGFLCPACKRVYPNAQGIARFVDAQHYAASFGFQWHRYQKTQLDHDELRESERHFLAKTALRPEDLKGKLVLDVGCGMGRFAEVATRWGARVVGVDLSAAAEVAAKNLADRDFVAFQADVFALPFAPESFDIIYSIGVLHHTPDCEQAFKRLPSLLKPGGRIAIWLYSGYNRWYRMSDLYRRVTRRMSPKTVHRMAHIAVPMYGVHQVLRSIPLVGKPVSGVMKYLLPMSFNPDPKWRVLDTLDWYSPWYQSKHTYEEVFRWFEDCGLKDLRVILQPISVQGQRPVLSAEFDHSDRSEADQCAV